MCDAASQDELQVRDCSCRLETDLLQYIYTAKPAHAQKISIGAHVTENSIAEIVSGGFLFHSKHVKCNYQKRKYVHGTES